MPEDQDDNPGDHEPQAKADEEHAEMAHEHDLKAEAVPQVPEAHAQIPHQKALSLVTP